MYFKTLPKLLYSTSLEIKNFKLVTNIFAKTQFIKESLNNANVFYLYDVKDGEKPEDIAYKLYGDSKKHWIILLANEIVDPYYDWVLGQTAFESYINKKYSSINLSLNTSEPYPSSYTVNEVVYQGPSYDASSCEASVVAYNSGTKTLQVKFADQVFANSANVTGVTSAQTHNIIAVSYNNDGRNWAQNTTSHYLVTEVKSNNFDKIKTTSTYKVSENDYNHSSHAVINRNTNTSSTDVYSLGNNEVVTTQISTGPVTYYDYEMEQNEAKRSVKLPKVEYISRIEDEFKKLMRS